MSPEQGAKANTDSHQLSGQAQLRFLPQQASSESAAIFALGLAIAGAAFGRSTILQMPNGTRLHGGLNLLIASESPAPLLSALARIIAPFKYEQAKRHLALAQLDQEAQEQALVDLRKEHLALEETDCMPAQEDLAFFDDKILELQRVTRPVMLLENPAPGRLTLSLGKSADATVFATFNDITFGGFLDARKTIRASMDFELLGKSFAQEIFDAAFLEGLHTAATISPLVSIVAVTQPKTLARLLTATEPAVVAFADSCLVIHDIAAVPGNLNSVPPAISDINWSQIVSRLLMTRMKETRIVHLSPEAAVVFASFERRVEDECRNMPPNESRHLCHLSRLVAKVALRLHVTQADASTPVPGETVARAVTFVESSNEQRQALLQSNSKLVPVKNLRTRVLETIIAFGPQSPRKICRHFHNLKVEAVTPVLRELVQAGHVEEQDGRYAGVIITELQAVAS